jgi:hypothetical protein
MAFVCLLRSRYANILGVLLRTRETPVLTDGWNGVVIVEGCIVGDELHAPGLRQPSWPLDERSHPSQTLHRGGFISGHWVKRQGDLSHD